MDIEKKDILNLIPLIFLKDEYHFLFEKRANNIRQGGEVSFPGGEFDSNKDKDFLDTAVRETIEEIGVTKEKIQIIGSMGTLVAPMGVTVDSFVGVLNINSLNVLKIDENEVERIFTIPVSYFSEIKFILSSSACSLPYFSSQVFFAFVFLILSYSSFVRIVTIFPQPHGQIFLFILFSFCQSTNKCFLFLNNIHKSNKNFFI